MKLPWAKKDDEGMEEVGPEPIEPPAPAEVRKMWLEGERETVVQRRSYALNRAFTDGEQWIDYDANRGTTRLRHFQNADERETRAMFNKIRQRRRSLVARLIPSNLTFEVRAAGADVVAMSRQLTQERILEAMHATLTWEIVRKENIGQTIDGGVAAYGFELDPGGGQVIAHDPQTGRKIRMPGVRITALSISEFTLEPGSRSLEDALWWMRRTTLTPKQAKKRYGLEEEPVADATGIPSATQAGLFAARGYGSQASLCAVYVYFQRPCDDDPGLICHIIGNEVVHCEPWPFPFQELNLQLTHETSWDGDWRGSTLMDDARQVQATYNLERTVIADHALKAANARILSPTGALDDLNVFSTDVSEVVEYNEDGSGSKPAWMEAPEISRWLINDGPALENALDDIFSSNEVSRGEAPGDRNSGLALSILAEKGDQPLSLMGQEQARVWGRLGKWTLMSTRHLLKAYEDAGAPVKGKATLTDKKTHTTFEVTYTANDIDEDPDVHVPVEATTPRSHAAAQAAVADLARTFPQVFEAMPPEQIATMLQLPNPREFLSTINPHIRLARYENLMIYQGEPMWPDEWNDHGIHIQAHLDEMNTPEFESWEPEKQDLLMRHKMEHERLQAQERQQMALEMQMAQQGQLPEGQPAPPGLPPASVIEAQSVEGLAV